MGESSTAQRKRLYQASPAIGTRASHRTELSGVNPKGGDLYISRLKPIERLVEGRSSINVQIICRTRVKGRKTHRTTK